MSLQTKIFSPSLLVILLLFSALVIFRSNNIDKKEIAWDVFGYYLPLVATFNYDDPMLHDRTWVDKLNDEKQLSGTVYQISSNDEGAPMYFFLFGMSYFYAVFYFIGNFLAGWTDYPMDGFSLPYQLALVYGCMIYTLIGLVYFRKVLLELFNETTTVLVIMMVVLGTNYAHHMSLKNLETVNVLFMLATILIWNTIQWHKENKFKNLIGIGVSVTLMALVKPSEILFLFLPILWNVTNIQSFREKWKIIVAKKFQFIAVIALCFIIASPQMFYWHSKTGHWIYDTYKNAGVGLDVFSPHIWNSLFSYRKGWLLYTPIMVFSLFGLYYVYKNNRTIFPAIIITLCVSTYIVFSWTEWWYGAGFSNRPMITYYALLGICLGYFLQQVYTWKLGFKAIFAGIIVFFIFLNQFQWWQLRQYILDPYRTTKEYYWATFLKISVTPEEQELLLINRDFSGNDNFENKGKYRAKTIVSKQFDTEKEDVYFSPSKDEFGFPQRIPYNTLTSKDHVWVEVNFDYKSNNTGEPNLVAFAMERKNGAYGYKTYELENDSVNWKSKTIYYLTPEIRNHKDVLKMDFWKRSPNNFLMDNFKLVVHEQK